MTFEIFFVTCRLGFASFPISSSKSEIFIEREASGIELSGMQDRRESSAVRLLVDPGGRFARFSFPRKGFYQQFARGHVLLSRMKNIAIESFFFSGLMGHVAIRFSNCTTYNCRASKVEGWQTVVLESAGKGNRVFFCRRVDNKHNNFIKRRFIYFNMDAIMKWLPSRAWAQKLAATGG